MLTFLNVCSKRNIVINFIPVLGCICSQRKVFAKTLKRIQKADGVLATLVINPRGGVWSTSMPNMLTALRYCRLWRPFATACINFVRTMDVADEIVCCMVTSKKHEILMVPDDEFVIMVLQKYGPAEKLYPDVE